MLLAGGCGKRAEPLSEVAARRLLSASVAIDNQTERVAAELVSGNFFSMLGVKPAEFEPLEWRKNDGA